MSDDAPHHGSWMWVLWLVPAIARYAITSLARGTNPIRAAQRAMNRFNPSALLWDIGVAIAVAATVLVVDYLPEPVLPDDPIARSEHLLAAGMPAEAEEALLPWFLDRLDSVEAHRRFLATHFRIPEHSATQQRDDDWIETLYRDDLASSAGHRHDVVTYGYGLFAAYLED